MLNRFKSTFFLIRTFSLVIFLCSLSISYATSRFCSAQLESRSFLSLNDEQFIGLIDSLKDAHQKSVAAKVRNQLLPFYEQAGALNALEEEVARQTNLVLNDAIDSMWDEFSLLKGEKLEQTFLKELDESLLARFKGYIPDEAVDFSRVAAGKDIVLTYQAKPTDPKSLRFSPDMAEEFNSSSKISKERREVFLQDIQKGVVFAKGYNGIKVVDGPIYEVKNVKDKLRFYGCNIRGVLRIVAVSFSERDQYSAISRAKSICKGL